MRIFTYSKTQTIYDDFFGRPCFHEYDTHDNFRYKYWYTTFEEITDRFKFTIKINYSSLENLKKYIYENNSNMVIYDDNKGHLVLFFTENDDKLLFKLVS